MRSEVLVIGYGNTLRGDDGAGRLVAQEVATKGWQQVRSLPCHQLTPELAEDIANSSAVIFVDAVVPSSSDSLSLRVEQIEPTITNVGLGHTGDPRSLLCFTQALYNCVPPAWWILIPAVNFAFGEQLSPVTERAITEAIEQIERLTSFLTKKISAI